MPFPFALPGTQNDGRNPLLLPNLDRPFAVNGSVGLVNPSKLAALLGSGTPASGSVTVAGVVASGDVITLTVANGVLNPSVSVSYTATSTDTVDTIAEALAKEINASDTLVTHGFWADAESGVVQVYQRGPVGNFTTLSASTTGAETFTEVQPSGGNGPIVPLSNFYWAHNGNVHDYFYGQPYSVTYNNLDQMVAQGMPIA